MAGTDTLRHARRVEDGTPHRGFFWARQWLDAIAPSNFLLTNPVALKTLVESGGKSFLQGIQNWHDDVKVGDLQMVDRSALCRRQGSRHHAWGSGLSQ
ncbi:hypothetical protein ACFS07_12705 [Undibacterium arcticum]